jgi:hypothetical protein
MLTLADLFLIFGIPVEAVLLILLAWRKTYRTLPVFSSYVLWNLISDSSQFALSRSHLQHPWTIYSVQLAIDSLFQFGVLFELSRSVFRPAAKLLPKWFPFVLGILIVAVAAALWPLARAKNVPDLEQNYQMLLHLQQSIGILRILFFLALAASSQLLSLNWRDRELQIATGLGILSIASLAVSVLHTRPSLRPWYYQMEGIPAASYLCSLLYWAFCFAQKEAERRAFTPQMQNLLLAMAGTAQTTRVAITESRAVNEDRNPGD